MIAVITIFHAVAMFALAYVVGHSAITKPVRERLFGSWAQTTLPPIGLLLRRLFVNLLECPACFGFWSGVAMAIFGLVPFEVEHGNAIAWGLFTSGSNLILAKLTKLV